MGNAVINHLNLVLKILTSVKVLEYTVFENSSHSLHLKYENQNNKADRFMHVIMKTMPT